MIIDLKEFFLGVESLRTECYDLILSDIRVNQVNPFRDPVRVKATIQNTAGTPEIMLKLDYSLYVPCDRCCVETVLHESLSVRHVLVRSLQEEDDEDLYIQVEDDRLDLDELVYADIVLNLPTKLLCSEDCKGLCEHCGINLNTASCSCKSGSIDPRLEALRQLLDEEGFDPAG